MPNQALTQDVSWIDTLRLYFELLYYMSGVALAIIACIALRQIKIAKADIRIRSRREAATLAALQHEKWAEKIIPMIFALDGSLHSHGISTLEGQFEGSIAPFNSSKLETKESQEWLEKCESVMYEAVDLLNAMDAIAVYFASGLADEELAFHSMGLTFCNEVEGLHLLITSMQIDQPRAYSALISLYNIWKVRINKLHLESQVEDLKAKLSNFPSRTIKPMGTDEQ
jgi:hypothetical protein